MKDCTILLNSCDSHSETWEPFCELLCRMWPSLKNEVILNTETKSFQYEGLKLIAVNTPKSKSWSDRLKQVLNHIHTPYLLVFLEDFFLEEPVDVLAFQRCFDFMKSDAKIGCISFHNTPDGLVSSKELPGYALLGQKARYRVNCQIGLWRTDVLRRILRSHETAWEFEVWGSLRSGRLPYAFYSIIPGLPEPFVHDLGKPIYRGYWNIESVKKVEQKTGIHIPTQMLPCIEDMSQLPKMRQKRTIKTYIRRIRSLFCRLKTKARRL